MQATRVGVLHAKAKLATHLLEYLEQFYLERPGREHSPQTFNACMSTKREFTQQPESFPSRDFFSAPRKRNLSYLILFFQPPNQPIYSDTKARTAARNAPFQRPGVDFDGYLASSSDVTTWNACVRG